MMMQLPHESSSFLVHEASMAQVLFPLKAIDGYTWICHALVLCVRLLKNHHPKKDTTKLLFLCYLYVTPFSRPNELEKEATENNASFSLSAEP